MKPILFNTKMVKAILEGRKTVTRRVVRPDAVNRIVEDENGKCVGSYSLYHPEWDVYPTVDDAPYQLGDILYVRETWKQATIDPAGGGYALQDIYLYKADEPINTTGMLVEGSWHPSIHMPSEAARIFLRVTDVRVERLQEITPLQAILEGISQEETIKRFKTMTCNPGDDANAQIKKQFSELWDSIIKPKDREKYGWDANPWVWVIEFERISKENAR